MQKYSVLASYPSISKQYIVFFLISGKNSGTGKDIVMTETIGLMELLLTLIQPLNVFF